MTPTELQFLRLCAAVYCMGITLACERADAWLAGVEGKGR